MPTTITEQINEIIDRRLGRGKWENNGRLQQIEKAEEHITMIREQVLSLKELLQLITYQKDTQHGEYYTLIQKDPEIEEKLRLLSTKDVDAYLEELEEEIMLGM